MCVYLPGSEGNVAFLPIIPRLSMRTGHPGIQVAPLESSKVSCLTLRAV